MCVIVRPRHVPFMCTFDGRKNVGYTYYLHTQKNTHTFLVTAISPRTDIALYDNTKKRPDLSAGALTL